MKELLANEVYCAGCGELIVDLEGTFTYEDKVYCSDCFENKFEKCIECDEYFPISEMTETKDGDLVCSTCLDEKYFMCDCCNEWVSLDESYSTEDGYVCDHCFTYEYYECEFCHEYIRQSSQSEVLDTDGEYINVCHHCIDNGNDICECSDCGQLFVYNGDYFYEDEVFCSEECLENYCEEHDVGLIKSYHYHKSLPTVFKGFTNLINWGLGIELEVECDSKDPEKCAKEVKRILGDSAYFEHDGSLDYGFEIITQPHTVKEFAKLDFKEAFNTLREMDCSSWNKKTCGLHVHISRKAFGFDADTQGTNIAKIILLHSGDDFERIAKISGKSINGVNSYARKCIDFYDTDFDECVMQARDFANYHYDRYKAINTTGSSTIEFRLGRGTLNYESFVGWINFILHLVKKSRTISLKDSTSLDCWIADAPQSVKELIEKRESGNFSR